MSRDEQIKKLAREMATEIVGISRAESIRSSEAIAAKELELKWAREQADDLMRTKDGLREELSNALDAIAAKDKLIEMAEKALDLLWRTAGSMNDLDGWIGTECGYDRVVPVAAAALAAIRERGKE